MLRRKLFFTILILAVVFLPPVTAQSEETLAVLDFTTEAVSETEMNAIVEFLSAELFNTDKYIVIDVSQRETILQEMEFSMSGCSDDSCALEIGKLLSAELIVVGNLSKVGSRYLMSVKMLETETSRTMGTANGKYTDLDDLIDGLESIAYSLAGMEDEVEAAEITEPAVIEPAIEVEQSSDEGKSESAFRDVAVTKQSGATGDFNWLSFALSTIGSVSYTASGVLRNGSFVSRMNAEEAYDAYMTSGSDPDFLYSGDGNLDYEQSYNNYKGFLIGNYINSVAGPLFSSASFFIGDTYKSTGSKIVYAIGALSYTAGNLMSAISVNNAFFGMNAYDEYISAGDDLVVTGLWDEYSNYYDTYKTQQYISYGLLGAGSLLTIGSSFIPGEKTRVASGLLEKIILTTGYLCMAGGNITSSMAINNRFNAEDAYTDFISAGEAAAVNLFDMYQNYQETYETLTYISYGLWGAGAVAIITAMLLPPGSDSELVTDTSDISIRPSLTGFGVEIDISLK